MLAGDPSRARRSERPGGPRARCRRAQPKIRAESKGHDDRVNARGGVEVHVQVQVDVNVSAVQTARARSAMYTGADGTSIDSWRSRSVANFPARPG